MKLDDWLQTQRGRLLGMAVELDRLKTTAGVVFGPGDLTYPEALLLGLLFEEREKYQQELMEDAVKKGRNVTDGSRDGRRR